MTFLRIFSILVVLLLPGAWVVFGRSSGEQFGVRIALAAALSPVIINVEFHLVRAAGISFRTSMPVLVALNLPALWLVIRQWQKSPARARAAGGLRWWLILCIPLLTFVPHALSVQARAYTGHSWLYSDTIYQIANGALRPEESMLAGVRLAYPWGGMVMQTLLSYLSNWPPVSSYLFFNLFWLAMTVALVASIPRLLGYNGVAGPAAGVWLLVGTNFIGDLIRVSGIFKTVRWQEGLWADGRFTPWFAKFFFLQQEPMALLLLAAVVYKFARPRPAADEASHDMKENLLLLGGLGWIYPILFPPAAIVGLGRSCSLGWRYRRFPVTTAGRDFIAVLFGSLVTAATVWLVAIDRTAPSVLLDAQRPLLKVFSVAVVFLPLLACLALVGRDALRSHPESAGVLLLGAAGSLLLYVFFHLPGWSNEYKFVFVIGLCLAPFAGCATERYRGLFPRSAYVSFVILTVLLTLPLAWRVSRGYPVDFAPGPAIDSSGFALQLSDAASSESRIAEVVRKHTQKDAVVVVEDSQNHLPTLMQRSLFAPVDDKKVRPGVGMASRGVLITSRGYNPSVLERRWSVVRLLYQGDLSEKQQALHDLRRLGRQLVIIVDPKRHEDLSRWLAGSVQGASRILSSDEAEVWCIGASGGP